MLRATACDRAIWMNSTEVDRNHQRRPPSAIRNTSLVFLAVAAVCVLFADLQISTLDPWIELSRMGHGLITPDFAATEELFESLVYTIAFALLGVFFGNVFGFLLALVFEWRVVQVGCALVRAVHELFWALIFLQVLGLTPWTGILAIGIPYAGIIAKVYAEILEEADPAPLRALPYGTGRVSTFLFARMPDALTHFRSYSLYRLECGLRSSAVLGFVGLPTLGFHLESAFAQGYYSQAGALLILFWVVIATIRIWLRRVLIPLYLIGALLVLPAGSPVSAASAWQFFTHDILPHPLRVAEQVDAAALLATWEWLKMMLVEQALPGIYDTVVLTMIALVATALLTLVMFPLVSTRFLGSWGARFGHVFLVIVRSTPEYVLAYVCLQLLGPSMLPAVIALSLHNGGIIGHLVGRFTDTLSMRVDSARGMNLYFYEVLPRVYAQFLAFLFYRWEVIMRETAILGMLGIGTLGFFVDSAFADIRFDRAMLLILITALLNIVVDGVSRRVRAHLRLRTTFDAS
ncbi:MAG: phosphonate transport system permease protein [Gammaproteobacteria bacterium]|jgi:phosphonate transport system permease protein